MVYKHSSRKKHTRIGIVILVVVLVLVGGATFLSRRYYNDNLKAVSTSQTTLTITIPKGSSLNDVADLLKSKKVIRSTWAFKQYVRNRSLQDKILAGTYAIKPSQDVAAIVNIITEGKIKSNLITITPGQRLDQIEQTFVNAGFDPGEVEKAFQPDQYAGHPALVDKPKGASLEGYLYPESFQKTAETTPSQIVAASLDEMQKRLTPDFREAVSRQGLSVYEAIVLGSIVEQEVSNVADKPQVAQVFLKRFKQGMNLGSDVTAFYGSVIAGKSPSVTFDSAYNTHYHVGLPPSPISNVSESSLAAVTSPASTDWLYFVAGDDGVTYFSKTLQEHEALTAAHCKRLCE